MENKGGTGWTGFFNHFGDRITFTLCPEGLARLGANLLTVVCKRTPLGTIERSA